MRPGSRALPGGPVVVSFLESVCRPNRKPLWKMQAHDDSWVNKHTSISLKRGWRGRSSQGRQMGRGTQQGSGPSPVCVHMYAPVFLYVCTHMRAPKSREDRQTPPHTLLVDMWSWALSSSSLSGNGSDRAPQRRQCQAATACRGQCASRGPALRPPEV